MKHGRLTYIEDLPNRSADNHIISSWKCDCGNTALIAKTRVKNGYTKSCGCLQKDTKPSLTHGMKYTKEYNTWGGMKGRCHNPKNKDYYRYGAVGILLCELWRDDFMAFYNYIGPAPTPAHQVDRIDNNRGYEPGNVRWATSSENRRNTTSSYDWYIKGNKFQSIQEAADFYNVRIQTIHKWVRGCYDYRRGTFTKPKEDCYTIPRYQKKGAL